MFDFGFFELMLIGIVALLVVGPDRLPALATFVGHWVGRLRSMANHMRREIRQELEAEQLKSLLADQNRELDSLRKEVEGIRDETEAVARDTRKAVAKESDAVRQAIDEEGDAARNALQQEGAKGDGDSPEAEGGNGDATGRQARPRIEADNADPEKPAAARADDAAHTDEPRS